MALRNLPWPFLKCNRGGGSSFRSQLLNALEYSLSLLELDLEEEPDPDPGPDPEPDPWRGGGCSGGGTQPLGPLLPGALAGGASGVLKMTDPGAGSILAFDGSVVSMVSLLALEFESLAPALAGTARFCAAAVSVAAAEALAAGSASSSSSRILQI